MPGLLGAMNSTDLFTSANLTKDKRPSLKIRQHLTKNLSRDKGDKIFSCPSTGLSSPEFDQLNEQNKYCYVLTCTSVACIVGQVPVSRQSKPKLQNKSVDLS